MIRSVAILLLVLAAIGVPTFLASRHALALYGPPAAQAELPGALCPPRRPVFVTADRRGDGTEVRAHCRGWPGWW